MVSFSVLGQFRLRSLGDRSLALSWIFLAIGRSLAATLIYLGAIDLVSRMRCLSHTISRLHINAFSASTLVPVNNVVWIIFLCVNLSLARIVGEFLIGVFGPAFAFILEVAYCYEEFIRGADVLLRFHVVLSGSSSKFLHRVICPLIFADVAFHGLQSLIVSVVIFVYGFRGVREPTPSA